MCTDRWLTLTYFLIAYSIGQSFSCMVFFSFQWTAILMYYLPFYEIIFMTLLFSVSKRLWYMNTIQKVRYIKIKFIKCILLWFWFITLKLSLIIYSLWSTYRKLRLVFSFVILKSIIDIMLKVPFLLAIVLSFILQIANYVTSEHLQELDHLLFTANVT